MTETEDSSNTKTDFDYWCDLNNPRVLNFEQISAAAYRIRNGILRTPCDRSQMFDFTGMQIYFKKDYMQFTGSFKERGARYTLLMLSPEEKVKGVIAASAGNHALALAYHGGQLGIPVTVVMPQVAPIMKVENCKKYGANIMMHGQNIGEARVLALKISKERGMLYVNGYDHPNILAGQGTMGLEILEQVPDVNAIVIPVGGGGLIAGVAKAVKTMKPEVTIIGVEPERCASFTNALKHGKPIETKTLGSLADGLTVPTVGVNALATAGPLVDKMVSVSEEWIAISILRLVELEKSVVEGGGASGVAAILAGLLPELKGKKVVVPLCGGNIDTTVLGRCLERGLAADGRLVKFIVTVSDRPGGVAELTELLRKLGVSIKDIVHERAWIRNDIFSVEIKVVAETRNINHTEEMFKALRNRYSRLEEIPGTASEVNNGVEDTIFRSRTESIASRESKLSFSEGASPTTVVNGQISECSNSECISYKTNSTYYSSSLEKLPIMNPSIHPPPAIPSSPPEPFPLQNPSTYPLAPSNKPFAQQVHFQLPSHPPEEAPKIMLNNKSLQNQIPPLSSPPVSKLNGISPLNILLPPEPKPVKKANFIL
ncbi:L-threonine ammonia-lyase isoform X2 [Lepeophtheirus salmonis]|uniref:L-threonine ammonia-lyase isoform X2 n=1 Tax=Lepeophtheirus salmonis TaxID=72036 RepID=UPI003AF3882F